MKRPSIARRFISADCYILWPHPDGFPDPLWALITDVRIINREKGGELRPSYVVKFPDGVIDYIPLEKPINLVIGDPYDFPDISYDE